MNGLLSLRRWGAVGLVACTLHAFVVTDAADLPPRQRKSESHSAKAESTAREGSRLREGLELKDEVGEFRDAGGRIAFYPANRKVTLTVLESLALERVYSELEQRLERRRWSVSGTVTEYRGGNYLQITRAVMKPKTESTAEPTRARATPSPSKP